MEDAGYPLTTSALSAWERDEYRPKSAAQVRALEQILGCEGELTAALGLDDPAPPRIAAIEARLGAIEDLIRSLQDEIRGGQ